MRMEFSGPGGLIDFADDLALLSRNHEKMQSKISGLAAA